MVFAQTQTMFSKDGKKATVLMLAMSSNPDAVAFNQVLNLPVEETSGKLTKKTSFVDAQGNKPMDLACAFSKIVAGTGSCFVVFHNVPGVVLNASTQNIQLVVEGADAVNLAKVFFLSSSSDEIFRSSDGHFVVRLERSGGDGNVQRLFMTYGN